MGTGVAGGGVVEGVVGGVTTATSDKCVAAILGEGLLLGRMCRFFAGGCVSLIVEWHVGDCGRCRYDQ
jgi:hypothetical protein